MPVTKGHKKGAWLVAEVKNLLAIFKSDGLDILKSPKDVNHQVAAQLAAKGVFRSGSSVNHKIKKLIKKYKMVIQEFRRGEKNKITWPLYKDINILVDASPSKTELVILDDSFDNGDQSDLNDSYQSRNGDNSWTEEEFDTLFLIYEKNDNYDFTQPTRKLCEQISGHMVDFGHHRSWHSIHRKVNKLNTKYRKLVKAWEKKRLLNRDFCYYEKVRALVDRQKSHTEVNPCLPVVSRQTGTCVSM